MFLKEFSKDHHFNKGARQSQAAGVADRPEKGGKKAQASPGQQGKEKGGKLLRFFLLVFYFVSDSAGQCKCCGEVISHPTCFSSSASGSEARGRLLRLQDQAGGGARGAAGREETAEGPGFPIPPRPKDPVRCCVAL